MFLNHFFSGNNVSVLAYENHRIHQSDLYRTTMFVSASVCLLLKNKV